MNSQIIINQELKLRAIRSLENVYFFDMEGHLFIMIFCYFSNWNI